MNIYITLDYEIYFGTQHGTVDRCILYPTSELIRLAEKHNVRFVFFVDCGFVLKLNEYRKKFGALEKDYEALTSQIRYLSNTGHDVQLHIHPHWEDSYFNGERWIIDITRYKLADFNEIEISEIVARYKNVLYELTGKKIFAYRAGGWCLQPFDKIKKALAENGITLDSSVFKNGYFNSEQYSYDFRKAPHQDVYNFNDDPIQVNPDGQFTEVQISGIRNSPIFFWKLFLLGRLNPQLHKPVGDGRAMPAPGYRKKLLTSFTDNCVSIDGYNANLLQSSLHALMNKKKVNNMVVIGHPKALSPYSIERLDKFISENKVAHSFTTFAKEFDNV